MSSHQAPGWRPDGNGGGASGLRLGELARKHVRRRAGLLLMMAAALGATTAFAATVPVLGLAAGDARLQHRLSGLERAGAIRLELDQAGGPAAIESFSTLARARAQTRLGPYVGAGLEAYQVGPLTPLLRNGVPLVGAAQQLPSSVGYMQGLSAHVTLIAGQMPRDTSPGLDLQGLDAIAATMSQPAADHLGINLSDHYCLGANPSTGNDSPRCFRLVGIWRPLDPAGGFWQAAPFSPELMVGRSDFMTLIGALSAGPGTRIDLTYPLIRASLDSDSAADLETRLGLMRSDLKPEPGVSVTTALDRALVSDAAEGGAERGSRLLGLLAGLLLLSTVALVAGAFLSVQRRELAVVVSQGWPLGRAWALLMMEMATGLGLALLAGLAIGSLVGAVAAASLYQLPAGPGLALRPGPTAALVAEAALAFLLIGLLVADRVRAAAAPMPPVGEAGPLRSPFRSLLLGLGLAAVAIVLLGLARLGPFQQTPAGDAAVGLLAAAMLLLAAASVVLLPPAASLFNWRRRGLASTVAGWNLEREPGQHAGLAILLSLAVAVATYAAVRLASGDQPASRANLVATAAAALATAFTGLGAHFAASHERRARDYTPPLVRGISPRQFISSLAREQLVVLGHGLLAGALLGLLLVVAVPSSGFGVSLAGLATPRGTVAAAAAVAISVLAVLAGGLAVGWIVRRPIARMELGAKRRRLA